MPSKLRVIFPITTYSWHILTVCVSPDYEAFANALRNIDKNPAVAVTIWQGGPGSPSLPAFHVNSLPTATGKWFCSGADVKARGDSSNASAETTVRSAFVPWVASTHLDTSKAVGRVIHPSTTSSLLLQISDHSKVLVAALNGPVMGKSPYNTLPVWPSLIC